MTKVIILGAEEKVAKQKKIKFLYSLVKDHDGNVALVLEDEDCTKPKDYSFIELIEKKYIDGYDMMFAYDDEDIREGVLYLGHFNDGVV